MRVLVDADACPVLNLTRQIAGEEGVHVTTVSSFRHEIGGEDHIMVGPEKEAADMAIINRTARGDVIVTQDWGLAALVLAKGARAISPWGHIFTDEEMEGRLAQRAMNARLRRGGVRMKGPRRRTAEDDATFAVNFRRLLTSQA